MMTLKGRKKIMMSTKDKVCSNSRANLLNQRTNEQMID